MPMPTPKKGEKQKEFISRCMGHETMNTDYPDQKQRAAVCYSQWRRRNSKKAEESAAGDGSFLLVDPIIEEE